MVCSLWLKMSCLSVNTIPPKALLSVSPMIVYNVLSNRKGMQTTNVSHWYNFKFPTEAGENNYNISSLTQCIYFSILLSFQHVVNIL